MPPDSCEMIQTAAVMYKLIVTVMMILSVSSAHAVGSGENLQGARLVLESTELDLGAIEASETAEGIVRFHNSGDSALVIKRIITECGCTVPSYPDTAINPGEGGEIKVRFIGKGRVPGEFRKILRIRSNSVNAKELVFVKGRIVRSYLKR